MQALLEEKDRVLKEKESEIASLQSKMKKRSREDYESGLTSTAAVFVGGDAKRFRLNNNICNGDHQGAGSATSCSSGKYHRNCKGHDGQAPIDT